MQVFAKTDIGKERKSNEDFYYISKPEDKIKLFILADGMGGYNAGEVASRMATETVRDYIQKHFEENKSTKEEIEQLLRDGIEYANTVVYKKAQSKKDLNGMGTTLDVCLIYNSKIYIGHLGDSRVYRIRKNFMRKLTKDHSYVQTLIEDGKITKEEALTHPKRNMLTKALGCTPIAEPDIYTKTFIKDDIILMSSDGLTNMVKENDIYNIIRENKENAAENLVKQANDNGGYDNITVVIIM
ncbi:MAG: Stp1/IreP family PP2C-type Ser/Thr phosphatase [Clostridia bacterium]